MAEELSFEEALTGLERIVQTLEAGGLTLEEAISLFEEGMRLAKICNQRLDAAELRISQLQTAYKEETLDKGDSPRCRLTFISTLSTHPIAQQPWSRSSLAASRSASTASPSPITTQFLVP